MSYYERHDDDEPIVLKPNSYEVDDADNDLEDGRAEMKIYHKPFAPLEEGPFKSVVILQGVGVRRLGVDLVTILDISASMNGFKIAKMKLAMKFLLHKLCPMDRLSVVTFSRSTDKLCPLRQITEDSVTEITHLVDNLVARGSSTKMDAGLKVALRILNDRTVTKSRRVAIMLISNGKEDGTSDAAGVSVEEVPVHTFGFGSDCEPKVLSVIAKNSNGGIFTPVQDLETFDAAFSASLAELLKVSVEDLTMTLTPLSGSKIYEVYAEHYQQVSGKELDSKSFEQPGFDGCTPSDTSVTIIFGSLYVGETRKVHANLILPEVYKRLGVNSYRIELRYRVGDQFDCNERTMVTTRTDAVIDSDPIEQQQDLEKKISKIRWDLSSSNASEEFRRLNIIESYNDRIRQLYTLLHNGLREPAAEKDNVEVKEEHDDQEKNYNFIGYESLREAVKARKWEEAHRWLKDNRKDINKIFASRSSGKEILHLTKKALRSNQLTFAEEIVKLAPPDALHFREPKSGYTILHMLAMWGNIETVKVAVKKNPKLTQLSSDSGVLPFYCAVKAPDGENEVLEYLYGVTIFEDPSLFSDDKGDALVSRLMEGNLYGMALSIMERFPEMLTNAKKNPLKLIVLRPFSFRSGANLVWWERFIYSVIEMDSHDYDIKGEKVTKTDEENPQLTSTNSTSEASTGSSTSKRTMIKTILVCIMRYLMPVPRMKQLHYEKQMHEQAVALVRCVLAHYKETMLKRDIMNFFRGSGILKTAIQYGTTEFVLECLQLFPFLASDQEARDTLVEMAVDERNDKVLDFICKQRASKSNAIDPMPDANDNTILHRAAKLAPSRQLNTISGAALQMQREIQWFKGIENLMLYQHRFTRNNKGETAQFLFAEKHKDLMEKGEKWMKSTSESCMLVATLIATVAFATAFTVPGGNISDNDSSNNGNPVFLKTTSFVIFAVADALALFSSITSVLMFLAVITSRYSEEDFLKSLPQKLILGLATLFLSMATILIGFVAAFTIVLGDRFPWAVIPVSLVACVPVLLFMLMQLPLFVEMVRHTYWPVTFGEQNQWRGVKLNKFKKEKQN